ncbi:NUDIX domain-containing protein [Arcanobacterium bovis]|uniref:NUDIX domain-containing protein n=1 Tax=Arcanobacterium bovis TaxID=2529275 RepID=A0A4Q9V1U4_9ACTO|nr:NUDIX domain-containing protein [Arcanobacterium bovis]
MSDQLEQEWPLDEQGFPHREAARVVIFNPRQEVYLIKGHDYADVNHAWWFTVGGGKMSGETGAEAAARELAEETGLIADINRFVGPVLYRESTFRFVNKTSKQDEYFFVLHVSDEEKAIIDGGVNRSLTALEKEVLDEHRWWNLEDLARAEDGGETVYPLNFVTMAQRWAEGWDGQLLTVVEH